LVIDRETRDLIFSVVFLSVIILVGVAGVLTTMVSTINAPVSLNVDISVHDGRYPLVVVFERNVASFWCNDLCPSSDEIKELLRDFCDSFDKLRQQFPDLYSQPDAIRQFVEKGLDKHRFYLVSAVRPSGVKLFQAFLQAKRDWGLYESSIPVPEGWAVKLDCK